VGSRRVLTSLAVGTAAAAGGVVTAAAVGLPALAVGAVAVPAYALGHAAAWLLSRESAQAPETPVDDDAEILNGLAEFQAGIKGRVPAAVDARVERIASRVRDCFPRLAQLGPMNVQAHAVLRTATSYLPEAVAAYLRLPRTFADNRPVQNGKTSLVVLCDQLDLLASKMDEVFDAVCRADADALIAHGRFLAEKFGSNSLSVAPRVMP
jgi:hypothetical protein